MKDIAIAIGVGSPNSKALLVKQTFDSIKKNIGICDWKIFIALGLNIQPEVKLLVEDYVEKYPDNFEIFIHDEVSWATFINKAIDVCKEYRYFIKSHDDIELLTSDFYQKITSELKKINKPVGWVSFTDIGWTKGDFSPATRIGYHLDFLNENTWEKYKVFQFHLFPDNWVSAGILKDLFFKFKTKIALLRKRPLPPYPKPIKKIARYTVDLPKSPVICHAPYNHFVLIEMKVLLQIGQCEDWNTPNALHVDEDWGLRAMELNFPNIWIPDINYFHYRGENKAGGTRSYKNILRDHERVEEFFYAKWGFHSVPTPIELKMIQDKYKNTLIPWSSYRKSYEWDYKI